MIVIPSAALPNPDAPAAPPGRSLRDVTHDWEWNGFQRIQLVEPKPRENLPTSRRATEDLLRDIHIEVQVAGGIRSADDIDALVQAGASHVVLGPRALDEPEWLGSAVAAFPDLLMVEAAPHERRVRSRGRVRTMPVDITDVADELSELRLAGLVLAFPADIAIAHAELATIEDLVERLPFPVFVSGGMPTLATLRDLEFRGVTGTIVDAALLAEGFDEQTLARSFVD